MSARRHHPGSRRAQSGIALILVIWVAALMVLFATAFSFSARGEVRLALRESERVRAAAAAEAGLRRTLLALMDAPTQQQSDPTDAVQETTTRALHRFDFDGVALTVHVIPQLAYIDINVSPEALITGLVETAAERVGGRSPRQVAAAVDSILDWRDADSRGRPNGAERSDYRAVSRSGPQDQPFTSVAELAQVMNVDRALFAAIAPMATVHSWVPQVDPLAADRAVLSALPDIDAEAVEQVLALRAEGADRRAILDVLKPARRYLARRRSATYTVLVEARAQVGVTVVRRAVVKLNRRGKNPVAVLAWHHDAGGRLPEPDAEDNGETSSETDS